MHFIKAAAALINVNAETNWSHVSEITLEPPHWPEKYAKLHVFRGFEVEFCSKNENSPPQRDLGAEVEKELP